MSKVISIPADFGQIIRDRRDELGYSQRAFAALVGSTQGHVWQVEGGARVVRLDTAAHWLAALGLVIEVRNPNGRAAR